MVIPRTQLLLRIVRGLKLDDILFNCHEHFLVWSYTIDIESKHHSHIQKRNPWWMWGAKVYQIIQWNKHRCLCTPDDYCSILSIEYIGSIQGKRVCNEQTHNHTKKRHFVFECAYARVCEWMQVWTWLNAYRWECDVKFKCTYVWNSHHTLISLWVQRYVRTVFEICKFKRRTVFWTIFLSYFESIDPKKLAYFKVAQAKYP